MAHNDHRNDPVREREVIVTDGGRRGGGAGAVIATIVGVLVVLLLAFLLLGGFGGSDGGENVDVEAPSLEVPDEVNVDVEGGGTEG